MTTRSKRPKSFSLNIVLDFVRNQSFMILRTSKLARLWFSTQSNWNSVLTLNIRSLILTKPSGYKNNKSWTQNELKRQLKNITKTRIFCDHQCLWSCEHVSIDTQRYRDINARVHADRFLVTTNYTCSRKSTCGDQPTTIRTCMLTSSWVHWGCAAHSSTCERISCTNL